MKTKLRIMKLVIIAMALLLAGGATFIGLNFFSSKPTTFEVELITNANSELKALKVEKNGRVEHLANPTREGYTFLNWYLDEELTKVFDKEKDFIKENTKLYARWQINTYYVLFETDGGTSINPYKIEHGSSISDNIQPPTKEGHSFGGWYIDVERTRLFSGQVATADTTLYAKWNPEAVIITFDSMGGSIVDNQTIEVNTIIEELPIPDRVGYNFLGWYTALDLDTLYLDNVEIDKNYQFLAKWERQDFLVSFETNMQMEPINPIKLKYLDEIDVDPLVLSGYNFLGWYLDEEFITPFLNGQIIRGNITLYAKWERIEHKISFDTLGGNLVLPLLVLEGEKAVLNKIPIKEGYTFKGWYSDYNLIEPFNENQAIYESHLLYAKWQINQYTISFDSNGGTDIASITEDFQTNIVEPTRPVKIGYTFKGWFTNSELTEAFIFDKMPAKNQKLYAKWEINRYQIVFITDGATPVPPTVYRTHGQTYQENEPFSSKPGYSFDGWYLDLNDETSKWDFLEEHIVESNIILYLKLIPKERSIKYYLDDSTIYKIETFSYQEKIIHPTPTKEGHTFKGWYENDILFDIELMPDRNDIVLFAKWDINSYNLIFTNANLANINYEFQELIAILPIPNRSGFTFAGWYLDINLTEEFNLVKMPSSDVLIYADWIVQEKTIGFESNGGNYIESIIGEVGDPVTQPANLSKAGHIFKGWYEDLKLTIPYVFTTIPEEGIIVYAKWERLVFTITFIHNSYDYIESPINVLFNDVIQNLPSPNKEGYVFAGWYLDESYNNRFNLDYMPAENITLYARWEITYIKIAFEAELKIPTVIAKFGEEIIAPEDPTKEGYTFTGWYEDIQLTKEFTFHTMPDSHVFLYAKWQIKSYILAFNVVGGELIDSIEFEYLEEISFNIVPEKEGYSFLGWYLDSEYQHEFDLISMPASDVVLYARWQINKYEVTFIDETTIIQLLDFDSEINYIPAIKTGYTFLGWYIDENKTTPAPTRLPAMPMTLYAKWKINQYTMFFESNGGTYFDPLIEDYNKLFTPPTPTRSGYTFAGWYADSKFKNEYTAIRIPANDVTIYAKWNINTYKMSFVTEGPVLADILYDYNATIVSVPTISKVGYTFKGWYLDSNYQTAFNLTKMPANDVRVYAKWNINQYTISFNSNGGSSVNSITKDFDAILTEPTKPIKTGYTFKGWYSDANLTEGYSFIKMPANNLTLYAKWEINTYKLSFISDGPSIADILYDYNQTILALPTISKTGYTFKGWYLDSNYQTVFNLTKMPANNLTAYAKWEINKYSITFVSNGGSSVSSITQDFGTAVVEPTKPTKLGYNFKGWFSDPGFNQGYNFILMPANNVTVYAKWEINTYKVSFNSNAGILISDRIYEYNNYIEALPILELYGNEFLGWYTPDNIKFEVLDNNSYRITSDLSLSAKWQKGVFEISFDSNGGTIVESIIDEYNEIVLEPIAPSKDKYQFVDWFKDEKLTEKYVFLRMSGEDVKLYAKWERVAPLTITYIRNDGTSDQVTTYQTNMIGTEIEYLDISRIGYSFNGWYLDESFTILPLTKLPDYDFIVYAKWTINRYTINLNLDGGIGLLSINQIYDSIVSPPIEPTKTGYTFEGWYQDSNKTIPYVFTKMPAEDITIYAKWEINQYTISFNSNGGSSVSNITKDYNATITKPTDPVKTGYTLKGWFTNEALTNAFTFNKMPANNVTLYAKWEINTYKIKFVTAGPAIADISYKYDQAIATLPTTTRVGYNFLGWFMESNYQTTFNLTSMPANNVTVYAKWEINQYTITFNSNGGTSVESITKDYNASIVEPAVPTKTGYTFVGWFINNQKYVFNKMEAKNITLVARWNQIPTLDFVTSNNNYFLLEGEAVVLRVKAVDDDLNRVVMEFVVGTMTYYIYLLPNFNTPLSTTLNDISASFDSESLEWLIILSGKAINNYFIDETVNLKIKIEDEFGHPFEDLTRIYNFNVTKAAEIISTTPAGSINVTATKNFKYEIEVKGDDIQMIRLDTNFLGRINAFADIANPYGSAANQNRLNSQGITLTYQTDSVTKISKLIVEFNQDATYYLSTLEELVITAKVEDLIGNITQVTTYYELIYSL